MHPQLLTVFNSTEPCSDKLNHFARENAERILSYIEDINLERDMRFVPKPLGSLSINWKIGDWEYQMECVKNGYIIYSFLKNEYQKASGCERFDDFIPQFEKYLLML